MPGDVRRRWDARRGVVEVKRPSNKCNGMTYDAELNLIVCEHATSSLIRERPDGRREVLASHFENQELNSPNDVCVHSSGAIYFSDPWYGRMPVYGVERPRQLGFQGVYRVPPGGGAPKLLVDRYLFEQPNGLCFSPDERTLYVNDTVQALIRAFDVEADGSLSNARVFASGIRSELEPGVPDGMKCDQRGNVWVTAPGGVWVYSPAGELLGKVRVPGARRQSRLGRAGFPHAVSDRDPFGLRDPDQGRAAPRALYERAAVAAAAGAPPRPPTAPQPGQRRHAARSAPLRDDHPGPAERRDHGRRRVRRIRRAGACQAAAGGRERPAARGRGAGARRRHHPCLVHRRAGRARRHAERAAVRRPGRQQGDGARQLGRGAGAGARAAGRRFRRREDAHERLGRHAAGDHPEGDRARHDHQHRRLDQHVGRAHRAHRRRQGLFHDRAGGLLLDHERRLAQRLDQLRAAERLRRDQRRRRPRRRCG